MQSAQAISAAYYFDLAARDYFLADGAIESVIEAIPRSALIDPSQNRELIFCGQSDWLRGRRHISNAGKFRRDLQEHSKRTMRARASGCLYNEYGPVMWMYFLVFVATLVVDSIPIFAPPAWTVLVLLLLLFHLNPWIVVIIGVTGSTLGRYILSVYIPKVSSGLVNRREDENLRYVGGKLTKAPFAAAIFVFLYTLTPLSTTALFTAAGIARVKPWHILPPFFCGRLITDSVMVYTGKYAAGNVSGLLQGQLSIKSMLTLIAGLLVIGAFLFIDWRCLLEKRKLRLNFRILR